ncbi:MAG TPA: metallophosphoesterase family protein [Candidatus Binatia bacterium]|nr:metallophosphoesterase family protein [Candidatus Binatia bacterium]
MNIFFWSDLHFNHAGMLRHGRPYLDVAGMNEALVKRWNYVVGPDDTIYVVGDFGFQSKKQEPLADIFARLNGHKHLVRGNHDKKHVLSLPWESANQILTLKQEGMRAELCHYPMESWRAAHRGALMVHGHSHGSLWRDIPHRFDVGADVRLHPVRFDVLWDEAATEMFEPTDHHGAADPAYWYARFEAAIIDAIGLRAD